jgi:hypothetical protein
MMVISPLAARTAPPDTGASRCRNCIADSRSLSFSANSGATVLDASTVEPGLSAAAAPCSPNSTVSVCAALTTSTISASTRAASAAGVAWAMAPSPAML